MPTDVHTCQTVTHLAEVSSAIPIAGVQIVRKTTEKKDKTKRKRNRAWELDPENNPAEAVHVKKIVQDKDS